MKIRQFKLLADENIDTEVVNYIRSEGFDVSEIKFGHLIGSSDADILLLAYEQERILLTHDSDFGTLAVAGNLPFVGIIHIRPGHIRSAFTVGTLRTLFTTEIDLNPPFIIVLTRAGDRVRMRVRQS